ACAVASLWAAISARLHEARRPDHHDSSSAPPSRLRDAVLAATGQDPDEQVDAVLVPALAAFLDQGVAYWPMPDRTLGFWPAFRRLVLEGPPLPIPLWGDAREALASAPAEAEDAVLEALDALGLPPEAWDDALEATAQTLPGWAGLVRRLEEQPEL